MNFLTLWDVVLDFTKAIWLKIAFCHIVVTKGWSSTLNSKTVENKPRQRVVFVRERPLVSSNRIRLILAEKSKAKRGMSKYIFSFTQASLIASTKFLHVFFLSVATYCARVSLIFSHVCPLCGSFLCKVGLDVQTFSAQNNILFFAPLHLCSARRNKVQFE